MMLPALFAFTLYAFSVTTQAYSSSTAPDCVPKCWAYSQYLSLSCAGDTKCLCEDAEFQNAVYQCLYSQCPTSKFGIALHHALGYCAGNDARPALISSASFQSAPKPTNAQQPHHPHQPHQPALLRNEGVKKRAPHHNNHNSNSVTRTHKPSVSASVYMTHTATRYLVTQIADGQVQAAGAAPLVTPAPELPANAIYRMAHDRHHGKWEEPRPVQNKWIEVEPPHNKWVEVHPIHNDWEEPVKDL